ncbi:MAG: ATP-binding protein [Acidobacteriota bacterium]
MRPAFDYALAAVAVLLVVAMAMPLRELLADPPSFVLFTPVVFFASYRGGMGPGLVATGLGAIAGEYYFSRPFDAFKPLDVEIVPVGLFLAIGVTISIVGQRLAAARADAARLAAAAEARAREAAEANRLKDDFLATLSHELRTPLNALLGWVQLLKSGQLGDERRARALEAIERSARLQAQLTADLLDISRIVSGKLHLATQEVRVEPLVEGALDSLRPSADAKGQALVAHVAPDLVPLVLDPARIQQVVWNLVSNAIKFTPNGGTITVDVLIERGELVVRVTDTGIGISAEFLPFVFDRFRQADGGTTRAHGGLGLGLAIVRHLVELHGGAVTAHSPGVGRGATFTVRIPAVVAGHRPIATPPASVAELADISGLAVLVVDDDVDGCELIRTLLDGRGARVRTAPAAEPALRMFDEARPQVVVTDLAMPGRDGFALLEAIRARGGGGPVPVVALTAHARLEDQAAVVAAGFDGYLAKPVEEARLVATLADVTGRAPRR